MSIRSRLSTLKRFTLTIAEDPFILCRVSLRQEYWYAREMLRKRKKSCGHMATVRGAVRRSLESCRVRDKGIFF